MPKQIRIQGFRVLVKPKEIEQETESGIILSYGGKHQEKLEQHKMMEGTVVQIGRLAYTDKITGGDGIHWCKVGDIVYYKQYSAKFIPDPEDDQVDYALLNDEDIIAVIEDGDSE